MTEQSLQNNSNKPIFPNVLNLMHDGTMFSAIEKGDLKMVQLLVENGYEVSHNFGSATLISSAVALNKPQIITYLAKKGADLEQKDASGFKPVEVAIFYGFVDSLKALVESGVSLKAKNHLGDTPLHTASLLGKNKMIDILAQNGADLNTFNYNQKTPLMISAEKGYPLTAGALLKAGADANIENEAGQTALILASQNGNSYTLGALASLTTDLNHQDKNGYTALMYAAENGFADATQLLLMRGAKADITSTKDGSTALILAIKKGHFDVVEKLIINGADVNVPSKYGSPLDYVQGILMRPELDPLFEFNTLRTQRLLQKHGAKTLETLVRDTDSCKNTVPNFQPISAVFQASISPYVLKKSTTRQKGDN